MVSSRAREDQKGRFDLYDPRTRRLGSSTVGSAGETYSSGLWIFDGLGWEESEFFTSFDEKSDLSDLCSSFEAGEWGYSMKLMAIWFVYYAVHVHNSLCEIKSTKEFNSVPNLVTPSQLYGSAAHRHAIQAVNRSNYFT